MDSSDNVETFIYIKLINKITSDSTLNKILYTYSQVTLKTLFLAGSLKLSSDEPVPYLDGWSPEQQLVL